MVVRYFLFILLLTGGIVVLFKVLTPIFLWLVRKTDRLYTKYKKYFEDSKKNRPKKSKSKQ